MKNSCKVTSQIEDIENHFKKKFSPDVSAIHPIQLTPPKTFDRIINIEEVQNAIKKLKNGKCQNNEGITAELVKYADKSITKIITDELNQAISLGKDIGINSVILIPIPKPHKTLKPENLGPICIVPVLRKILSLITLNRIQEAAEEFIGPTQSAFKKVDLPLTSFGPIASIWLPCIKILKK